MKNTCSVCGAWTDVNSCLDGFVCEPCIERVRVGRDNATRRARTEQRAMRLKADALRTVASGGTVSPDVEYAIAASEVLAGGEALPAEPGELRDTMQAPGATALDASAERLALVTAIGSDCAAMALDAADTVQASNSLEKMLSHQLAALHKVGFDYMSRAAMVQDANQSARIMNLAIRAMSVYQDGLLTLKKFRSTGEQKILIERVNVEAGGQAIVGNVNKG